MFQPLIELIALIFGTVIVLDLYEHYVNYSVAKKLAEENAREKSLSWDRIIVTEIEKGNVNYVRLGIFNRGEKKAEIRINTNRISDDLSEGMVL
jgi:hypothetical protein